MRGRRGWRLWKLLVTSCVQAAGAPPVDEAYVVDADGRRYIGVAIALCRPRHLPGVALVLGWRQPERQARHEGPQEGMQIASR